VLSESTHESGFVLYSLKIPDELFALRDGQFDNPQIAILRCSAMQILLKFCFVFMILRLRKGPTACTIRPWQALVYLRVGLTKSLIIRDNNQDRAAVGLAAMHDQAEAAFGFDKANQGCHFKSCRKAASAHLTRGTKWSGSVAVDDIDEQCVDGIGIGRGDQALVHAFIAHQPGDRS
jgi:hypothetical protein